MIVSGIKTSLVLSTVYVLLSQIAISSSALAEAAKTEPTADATSVNAEETVPMCSPQFARLFGMTVREFQMVSKYVNANEMPPNLPDTVALCEKISKDHSGHICRMNKSPRKTSTSDLAEACASASNFATKLQLKPISKNAMILMPQNSVLLHIRDVGALTKMLEKPRSRFIIDGKVMEEVESGMRASPVRCSFDKHSNTQSFVAETTFKTLSAQQVWVGNFRITTLAFADQGLILGCLTDSTQVLTTELLQKAFGSVADVIIDAPAQSLQ